MITIKGHSEFKGLYCGKPIHEMTREELIEALLQQSRINRRDREEHTRRLDKLASYKCPCILCRLMGR